MTKLTGIHKVEEENAIVAYKVFNSDWTCRNFQYEVGNTYSMEGDPSLCERGFHACVKAVDCFNYYQFDTNNKVAMVKLWGTVDFGDSGSDKVCANNIEISEPVSWGDVLDLVNSGNHNSGYRNSGHRNSGHRNSGHRNSGNHNSGNYNNGNYNNGNYNSGHYNSGHYNSGHRNSGHHNSGSYNNGNCNSGYYNSGHYNSGHYNSGNHNSGSYNSGYFNADSPSRVRVFGGMVEIDEWANAHKPAFLFFDLDPGLGYKGSFTRSWEEADHEDRMRIKDLPNFNEGMFYEISGIRVSDYE